MDYNYGYNSSLTYDPLSRRDSLSEFGTMPLDMLAAKFDETPESADIEEYGYYNYSRSQIMDRSPDAPFVAEDDPRFADATKMLGRVNLRVYGQRYTDIPKHPEAFLGIDETGPEGGDFKPGLDYRELARQGRERMRFKKFGADADNSITGGFMTEETIRDRFQNLYRIGKPRLKIFSTSYDSILNGIRRDYQNASVLNKVKQTQSYGDMITDAALNRQRHTIKLSNQLSRQSDLYPQAVPDHLFDIAKYGSQPHRKLTAEAENRLLKQTPDGEFDMTGICSSAASAYKFAGVLTNAAMKQRRSQQYDQTSGQNNSAAARRASADMVRDAATILAAVVSQQKFAEEDGAISYKTNLAAPGNNNRDAQFDNVADLPVNDRPAFKYFGMPRDLVSVLYKVAGDIYYTGLTQESSDEKARKTAAVLIDHLNLRDKTDIKVAAELPDTSIAKYKSSSRDIDNGATTRNAERMEDRYENIPQMYESAQRRPQTANWTRDPRNQEFQHYAGENVAVGNNGSGRIGGLGHMADKLKVSRYTNAATDFGDNE